MLLKSRCKQIGRARASLLWVNNKNLVFSGWSANLCARKKSVIFFSSWLALAMRLSRSGSDNKSVVSSANKRARSSEQRGRSLMYIRKRRGPRIDPWGTPKRTLRRKLLQPLIFKKLFTVGQIVLKPQKFHPSYTQFFKLFEKDNRVYSVKRLSQITENCNGVFFFIKRGGHKI